MLFETVDFHVDDGGGRATRRPDSGQSHGGFKVIEDEMKHVGVVVIPMDPKCCRAIEQFLVACVRVLRFLQQKTSELAANHEDEGNELQIDRLGGTFRWRAHRRARAH